jgi:ribosomal protein S27AE
MGREKEEQIVREEQARRHAKKCSVCGEPLLTAAESSKGICSHCQSIVNKAD